MITPAFADLSHLSTRSGPIEKSIKSQRPIYRTDYFIERIAILHTIDCYKRECSVSRRFLLRVTQSLQK